jgi:hypothetical protein
MLLVFLLIGTRGVFAQQSFTPIPARQTKTKPGLVRLGLEIPYSRQPDHPNAKASLVFDAQFAYLASPDGLYRTALPITSQSTFRLIGFENRNIFNLYVHDGSLYVLKESIATQGSSATDHSFLRSDDHGVTFVPLDNGLEECLSGYCEYLSPIEAIVKNGLIFINAGAGENLFVTANNGLSWTPLMGSFHRMIGGYQAFELTSNRMVVGGDSLDDGYLRTGTLNADMLTWDQPPANVAAPDLQGRPTLVVKAKPNSSDEYAAVVGGLLKSTDGGQNFRYVVSYSMYGSLCPFIKDIMFPSHAPNVVVIAGRDPEHPFLAYSKDNGETWLDISAKVRSMVSDTGTGSSASSIDFLSEDTNGQIFAGVIYGPTHTLKILRLEFNSAAYR